MKKIDFYCKKCKKTLKVSYELTGNDDSPVMPNIVMSCHTHKCVRVMTFKNFTEGMIVAGANKEGKYFV
ncbi:MAG TPA: hypothetical protein GX710_06655 [Clostridiales bacterium]|jgi:RNase P subunit RPR2|nr:hypothetical protein [Clostridiales bacterium]